mmetsp:Transcript_18613/g.43140  ORF Transcript_18613/g.43140 Transcript_18613/m.43140 type:complete len:171 (-) Transcript_18613:498-1010(-)
MPCCRFVLNGNSSSPPFTIPIALERLPKQKSVLQVSVLYDQTDQNEDADAPSLSHRIQLAPRIKPSGSHSCCYVQETNNALSMRVGFSGKVKFSFFLCLHACSAIHQPVHNQRSILKISEKIQTDATQKQTPRKKHQDVVRIGSPGFTQGQISFPSLSQLWSWNRKEWRM